MMDLKYSGDDRALMRHAIDVMTRAHYPPGADSAYYTTLTTRLGDGGDAPQLRDVSDIIEALYYALSRDDTDWEHDGQDYRPAAVDLLSRLARVWHPIGAYQSADHWGAQVQLSDGYTTEVETCDWRHKHPTEADADACGEFIARSRWYASRVMIEIRNDMAAGRVPVNVKTFSELHDHVDANMYLIDVVQPDYTDDLEHYGDEHEDGSKLDDAEQALVDAEIEMGNAVSDIVNDWLQASAAGRWCRTCGQPVEKEQCNCWCLLSDALQRFLGWDFDHAADVAARMWGADADKVSVWLNVYAVEHDVPVYDPPPGGGS